MIRVVCSCGRAFKTEDRNAGKRATCPECGLELMIGPTPEVNSSGGDADEVSPSWYAGNRGAQRPAGVAPTRSGSDPGTDAVDTMVFPAAREEPRSRTPSDPDVPTGRTTAQPAGSKPPGGSVVDRGQQPSFSISGWVISAGIIVVFIAAIGATLWVHSRSHGSHRAPLQSRGIDSERPPLDRATALEPPTSNGRSPKSADDKLARSLDSDGPPGHAAPGPQREERGQRGEPASIPGGAARRLRLLVPVYIYPTGEGRKEWQRLFDAAAKAEIVAVANPSSGPGEARDLDYAAVFAEASNLGITLVGYVSTNYAKRPQTDIKHDIDTWIKFYPKIRGFFFDQQPHDHEHAADFAELRDYVKAKLHEPFVVTNPGVPCDEAYLAQSVANLTCVFTNFEGFDRFELPAPLRAYDPSRFAAMAYNLPDVEAMRTAVKEAIIKRIGYIYITDAKPPVRWDKLPSYWEAEVDAVSRLR